MLCISIHQPHPITTHFHSLTHLSLTIDVKVTSKGRGFTIIIFDDAIINVAVALPRAKQPHQDQTQRDLREDDHANQRTAAVNTALQSIREPDPALAQERNQQDGRNSAES